MRLESLPQTPGRKASRRAKGLESRQRRRRHRRRRRQAESHASRSRGRETPARARGSRGRSQARRASESDGGSAGGRRGCRPRPEGVPSRPRPVSAARRSGVRSRLRTGPPGWPEARPSPATSCRRACRLRRRARGRCSPSRSGRGRRRRQQWRRPGGRGGSFRCPPASQSARSSAQSSRQLPSP